MDGTAINDLLAGEHHVVVLDEIDSTNEEIKRRARAGTEHGLIVIAERQTAGKGRNGRSFFSPKGTGIYLSVLLDVHEEMFADVMLLTTQAAVAVAHAVSEVCHRETWIKWVNDVYYEDKKICGILAEALTEPETGQICQVIAGIGINVYRPREIPEELTDVVGYVMGEDERVPGLRERLAAAVINELTMYYEAMPDRSFISEYRERSRILGQTIRYGAPQPDGQPGEDWKTGIARAIDDSGGLVIECSDGNTEVLRTGEISVRIK